MKIYKQLASHTLLYGLATVLPRVLNYVMLTPYFTRLFSEEVYGQFSEVFSYAVLLMVVLTYGLETGFFRFAGKSSDSSLKVFSTALSFILISSALISILVILFGTSFANLIHFEHHILYLKLIVIITAIDAVAAIPFAQLRYLGNVQKFVFIKLMNVIINICLVLIFYELLPRLFPQASFIDRFQLTGILMVLVANVITSFVILLLLYKEFRLFKIGLFDKKLLRELMIFSIPLMVAGISGAINDVFDRVLMSKTLSTFDLGIYAANMRIAMLLYIFIQMFRYAAEPIFFKYYGKSDDKILYSNVMRLFIAFSLIVTLAIVYYLDIIKILIGKDFRSGLHLVFYGLLGYVLYGMFFNLSIWYKLSKRTLWGLIFTLIGAAITIFINIYYVPRMGYEMAAIGHIIAYGVMVVVSYVVSRFYYPIDYKLKRILIYFIIFFIGYMFIFVPIQNMYLAYMLKTILLIIISIYYLRAEGLRPKQILLSWKSK